MVTYCPSGRDRWVGDKRRITMEREMNHIQQTSGFPVNRRQRELMVALAVAVGLLTVGRAVSVYAQSAQVGRAQNAIGSLVVVRPDGIEDRLQGKGSLQLF